DAVDGRELEREAVELAAWHRDAETRTVPRVLEREENARPALRAPQLRDLALDPDRRQAREPGRDTAVERADGVDLAVAVRGCLEVHEARVRRLPAAGGGPGPPRAAGGPPAGPGGGGVG